MPNIIAGRFQELEAAAAALSQLVASGVGRNQIASFFAGPAGQRDEQAHEARPEASTGSEQSPLGAATGALGGIGAGAAVGAIGGPIGAAAGAAVGAYVGSFVGALHNLKEAGEADGTVDPVEPQPRKSGVVVAVMANDSRSQANAIVALRAAGAADIEYAEGNIIAGEWTDFDPGARMSLADDNQDAEPRLSAPTR